MKYRTRDKAIVGITATLSIAAAIIVVLAIFFEGFFNPDHSRVVLQDEQSPDQAQRSLENVQKDNGSPGESSSFGEEVK